MRLHMPLTWAPFKAPSFRSLACHGCEQPGPRAPVRTLPCKPAASQAARGYGSSLLSVGCLAALATVSRSRARRGARVVAAAGAQREAAGDAAIGQDGSREAESADEDGGPVKALEAWLLQLELPQPLKPVLGTAAWYNFGAALFQMGIVAFLAGLGTFLEQGEPASFYVQRYPELSAVILTLGLDRIYGSPLFLVLLAWLGASLLACSGTTQIPLARRAQRLSFMSPNVLNRVGTFVVNLTCPAAAAGTAGAVGPTLQRTRAALERRGFVVVADSEENPKQLSASRGLSGKFAPLMVHVSLVIILLGGAAGLALGSSSEVMVGDGGEVTMGSVLDRGRREKGPLYSLLNPSKGVMDATLLKVDDFRIQYRAGGEVEQFYSKLTVRDQKSGEQMMQDEIYVNKPLAYAGATVYQADWGIDRLQMYINDRPVVIPLKQLPSEGASDRSWGAFLPMEVITAEDPNKVTSVSSTDGLVLVVENMRNVQVYGSDKSLAAILRSPDQPMDPRMTGMPVPFGEAVKVDGVNLRLDRILGATGLIVKNDPGVPLVYLGFALVMPATLASLVPFSQVWATVSEDGEEEERIVLGGKTNRNTPAFEDEMKAMVLAEVVP
mmetsp:Transcript_8593/g.15410  ORF Transcript_8593/g.15410 Transcript_8593/m.15410 type:complete len:610 (-) Transcript_8593:77-1906(-)